MIKICPYCNKSFSTNNHNKIFCSRECQYRNSKKPHSRRKHSDIRVKDKSLDDYVREAAMCRMSYGQYRAALAQGKTFEELRRH